MNRAVIRVGIVSRSATVRAGLRALLDGESMHVEVESPSLSRLETHHLDVIVTDDAGLEAWSGSTQGIAQGSAIVLLSDDPNLVVHLIQLEPSGWALVSTDAPADELRAAITAAAHGLVALPVGLLDQRWLATFNDPLNNAGNNGMQNRTDLESPISPETLSEELTARERDVLELLSLGLPNKIIARRLAIGESTVKFHLAAIYAKLGVSSRTAAVSAAARRGWVTI
jgi:DNA-binding NarL/FixJ family response regulator